MTHRIGARGILIGPDDTILLALEQVVPGTNEFWVPPGGGLEPGDGSAVACVRREFREETGLTVEVGPLMYVREFLESSRQTHHLNLYFSVHDARGNIFTTDPRKPPRGTDPRRHVRWFSQEELQTVRVYPEELRHDFWRDRTAGVTPLKYLGVSHQHL